MRSYLSLVKFAHTIFALPFALVGFFLGWVKYPHENFGILLIQVIACMVFARSAAMAFNRYVDRDIDQKNPRTQNREIPSGVITPSSVLLFVILNALAFIVITYTINMICFLLSPVALGVILSYSYTKRFTYLCHFILGLGLSLAPIGAYLAVTGKFELLPILYAFVVLFWVSGFDIIYALQDDTFDKNENLFSIPVKLGKKKALTLSGILHLCCGLLIIITGIYGGAIIPNLQIIHWIGVGIFLILLFYQHRLVKPGDLSKVNLAFFTTNGIASLVFSALFIIDLLI